MQIEDSRRRVTRCDVTAEAMTYANHQRIQGYAYNHTTIEQ